ncbi:MAG: DNA translocase FtsK [Chloroflexi bacterium]|nr:DNA translocase FtsK [Chloroflexota bacterium]
MSFLSRLFRRPPPDKGKGDKGGGKKDSKPKNGGGKPRAKRGQPPPEPPPAPKGLSLDQKLDITGIILIVVGILIALAFLSPTNSSFTAPILTLLGQLFGVGRYLVPLGMILLGAWVVMRHFGDKLPRIAPERVLGWALVYLAALVSLHFAIADDPIAAFRLAEQGAGGGWIGAVLLVFFLNGIGTAGTFVAVLAWWIIALILAAGLSTQQLIGIAQKIVERLRPRRGPAGAQQLPLPTPSAKRPAQSAPPTAATPTPPPPRAEPTLAPAVKKPRPAEAAKAAPPGASSQTPESGAPTQIPPAPLYDQPIIIGGHQPWVLPEVKEMLEAGSESGADDDYDRKRAHVIEDTLNSFGAPVKVVEINRGPTITQFGVEPDYVDMRGKKTKVKVGKISALADDLALALAAPSIRIEAPVPGKGYVGIEVPNHETALVALRDVMESEAFAKKRSKSPLAIALGQDVSGQAVCADLTKMPHLLVAGTTGSGKSVCVNSVIATLLIQNTPDDIKLLMVDPKRVELTLYNGIPHLLTPVIVDLERVVNSLQWVTREMDERYRKFAKAGTRNIEDYNARMSKEAEKKLPYLIVIIDELADLMMLAPDETEKTITRLAQMARATGIHLIIATQRPSVDVVTGLIKANFPARIAFAVASSVDSRVILDQPGAEKLLGRGDMLFQSPDAAQPLRMQGVYVSDTEIHRLVRYWKGARGLDEVETPPAEAVPSAPLTPGAAPSHQPPLWEEMRQAELKAEGEDDLFEESVKVVREMRRASITLLQRRLRIGYGRAARLIDLLEEKGIVGPAKSGAQQREVIGFSDMEDLAPTNAPPDSAPAPLPRDKTTWEVEE